MNFLFGVFVAGGGDCDTPGVKVDSVPGPEGRQSLARGVRAC
jgi:hypothetical protein